jgi:hypothetical protein
VGTYSDFDDPGGCATKSYFNQSSVIFAQLSVIVRTRYFAYFVENLAALDDIELRRRERLDVTTPL